jgi:hypothetical protein
VIAYGEITALHWRAAESNLWLKVAGRSTMNDPLRTELDELSVRFLCLDARHAALLLTVAETAGMNEEQLEAFGSRYEYFCDLQFRALLERTRRIRPDFAERIAREVKDDRGEKRSE